MTNKPKFKTLWTNTKKGDTSNDLIIHKYRGTPLQLIELNGQQVLVIQYENTLEFLDPYTFTPVDSPFKIAAKKTAVYRHTGGLIKVASEWCMLCMLEDSKNHYQIVICNLASKQTSILKETSTWINKILVVDIAEQQYAFVTYKTSPTIRVKYNLQTQKEELQVKLPIELSDDLHFMEHLGTQYPNDTIIDAQTGEQIGVEKNIKILKVNNRYLMAAITNNNQLDILDANVPSAPKLIHSILIDNDGDWSLIAHKSKLIAASFNKTKVYDLEHPEQDPVVCFWDDGTLVGSGRNLYPIDYQGASFVIQAEMESACFSLDTGKERTDIKHVSIVGNLLSFTDKQNRALFIARCGESFGDQYTVLFNPKGHIRSEDEYEYHYHAVTTTIEDTEVCITHTNRRINIYHLQTGAIIKSVSIAHSKDIKQLMVTEIGHKPILLALCNKEIKAYTLPDIEDTMISFPIADAFHMDIIEMEGKRQLMATNTEIFRWDLEIGTPICNPKFVFDEGSKEHNEGYYIRTLRHQDNEYLFVSTIGIGAGLWYPNKPGQLIPLLVDDAMLNFEPDDPDYIIYDAISTTINTKEVVVTASHHGAVVVFDPKTGKRIGRIMRARTESESDGHYMRIMDFLGQKLLITNDDHTIKIWTLADTKKLKEINFEEKFTSVSIVNNKIIIFHGENITAIEVRI